MRLADIAHAKEFLPAPQPARWVVGIAEQECFGRGVRDAGFEIGPVGIVTLGVGIPDQYAAVFHRSGIGDVMEETVVCGSEEYHLVAWFGESLYSNRDGRHYPLDGDDVFPSNRPAVTAGEPAGHAFKIGIRNEGVAENGGGNPAADGPYDEGCDGEIHFRNPHGQHVGTHVPFY